MSETKFLLTHQDRSRYFTLKEGQEAMIGRSLDAAFFLSAPSISRRHCVLRATKLGVEVVDVSSRKDCFLNGRRVAGAPVLSPGCVLQIGGLAFRYDPLEEQRAPCVLCTRDFALTDMSSVDGLEGGVCAGCLETYTPSGADRYVAALQQQGYTVLEALGGAPPAYKVESNIGKVLTVLTLPLTGAQDPEALRRVREEARLLARLSHENILPLYDIRETQGFLLLVMAFQEGVTLEQRVLNDGPLDPKRAVAVGRACLSALAHADEHGVSHRDLRPAHISMTRAGSIVVKGFSISSELRALSLSLSSTGNNEVAFVAPELFADGEAVSARADLYGAGAVFYYALKGHPPYEGLSPAEFVWNVGLGDGPQLDLAGIPPSLARLLESMLALDTEKRPANARAALQQLDEAWAAEEAKAANRIEGGFKGDELIEFLQLIEFQGKSGDLEIIRGAKLGTMRFRSGELAAAEAGERTGMGAVRKLLTTREGRFRFTPRAPSDVEPGLRLKISALLLDLARAVDESGDDWTALAGD